MKKTILSLFILATIGITGCSSDSNSEASTNPNDLLVVAFKATGEGTIENFARDKEGTKVLSLDGQSNNANLIEVTITKNGTNSNSSFTINDRNVTTKNNTPVGEYSISYRITNGTSTSNTTTQSFTVYYNESKTFDGVTATIYQFRVDYLNGSNSDSNEHPSFDGIRIASSPETRILNGVPYQFLIGSRLYQLSLENPTNSAYNFPNTSGTDVWKICELSLNNNISDFLLPTEVINKSIRTKTYNKVINNNQITHSITFYELGISFGSSLEADYREVPENAPNPNNSNNVVVFGRDQI